MSRKPYQSQCLENRYVNYAAHLLNYAKNFELWRLDIQKWVQCKCRILYQKLLPQRNLVRPRPPLGEGTSLGCAVLLADAITLTLVYEQKCEDYIEAFGRLKELITEEIPHWTGETVGKLQLLQEYVDYQADDLSHLRQEIYRERYDLLRLAYPERNFEELPSSTFHLWHTFTLKELDATLRRTMQLCESVHSEEDFPMVENPFCSDVLVYLYQVDNITEEGYLLAKEKFKALSTNTKSGAI